MSVLRFGSSPGEDVVQERVRHEEVTQCRSFRGLEFDVTRPD